MSTMQDWLIRKQAEYTADYKVTGSPRVAHELQKAVDVAACAYPSTRIVFDFGASFEKRVSIAIEHELGFTLYSLYRDVGSERIEVHDHYDEDRLLRWGVEGFERIPHETLTRDFLALLEAPAPE